MNNKFILKFDWYTFLVYFALVAIGLINIYSIGHTQEESMLSLNHTFGKQLFFSLLSIGLIFFLQFPKVKVYERYSSIFYLIILALLIGLFVFGKEVSGAKSWYSIAGFSFQPAEFAKVITALALTKHLSEINTDLTTLSDQLTSFVLIFPYQHLSSCHNQILAVRWCSSVFFWFYTQKNSLSIFTFMYWAYRFIYYDSFNWLIPSQQLSYWDWVLYILLDWIERDAENDFCLHF